MGMNKRWSVLAVAVMISILAGSACTKAAVPSCTDEKVKAAVLEKAREISRDILVAMGSAASFKPAQVKGAYQALKAKMEQANEPHREEIGKLLSSADSGMAKISLELADLRLMKKDDAAHTVACAGGLMFSNNETKKQNKASLEFTAQYNEDHTVRIEMTRF